MERVINALVKKGYKRDDIEEVIRIFGLVDSHGDCYNYGSSILENSLWVTHCKKDVDTDELIADVLYWELDYDSEDVEDTDVWVNDFLEWTRTHRNTVTYWGYGEWSDYRFGGRIIKEVKVNE